MPKDIRVFIDNYDGFGVGVSSPELPTLAGGFSTRSEAQDEDALHEMLCAAGMDPHASHRIYFGEVFNAGDEETVVTARFEADAFMDERARSLSGIVRALKTDGTLAKRLLTNVLGDVSVVVCLPDDSLRKATRPFVEGQPTFLAMCMPGGAVQFSEPLVDSSATPEDQAYFHMLGLSQTSTVAEFYDAAIRLRGMPQRDKATAHSTRALAYA